MTPEIVRDALPTELDLRRAVPGFAEEISADPGCDTLLNCYQCGVCTGTCPVSELDDRFSPALIIQWVRMGLRRTVLESPLIWYCLQCHRCSFHCPQGVRFADVDAALRARAVEEGFMSRDAEQAIRTLEEKLRRARLRLLNRFFEEGQKMELCFDTTELVGGASTGSTERTPVEPPSPAAEEKARMTTEQPASRQTPVEAAGRGEALPAAGGPEPQWDEDTASADADDLDWGTDSEGDSENGDW